MIDTHCHLDDKQFDTGRLPLLKQCLAAGMSRLILPGIYPSQWPQIESLCKQASADKSVPNLHHGVGLHPWFIDSALSVSSDGGTTDTAKLNRQLKTYSDKLLAAGQSKYCVAVGECGLDKLNGGPMAVQQALLEIHIDTSRLLQKPLILHCVGAHNQLQSALKRQPCVNGGVVHGFSGSTELAEQYWRKGFYLGIGGVITYARAKKTREAVKHLPLESLLLETDAPFMPLAGQQGQANSPLNIRKIAETIAQLRGDSLADVLAATEHNAQILFPASG